MNHQLMRPAKHIQLAALSFTLFLAGMMSALAAESQKLLKDTPFEEIVAKAKAGNAEAQMYLAKGHSGYATGVPFNKQESHRWYVAAATNNVPDAQLYLGDYFYREATSTKGAAAKDKAKRNQSATVSMTWYLKAAKQGSFDSWVRLGNAFEDGSVFAKDPIESYKWYHLAIEKSHGMLVLPTKQGNALSLSLTPTQIELAKRRAQDFWDSLGEEKKPTAPK